MTEMITDKFGKKAEMICVTIKTGFSLSARLQARKLSQTALSFLQNHDQIPGYKGNALASDLDRLNPQKAYRTAVLNNILSFAAENVNGQCYNKDRSEVTTMRGPDVYVYCTPEVAIALSQNISRVPGVKSASATPLAGAGPIPYPAP